MKPHSCWTQHLNIIREIWKPFYDHVRDFFVVGINFVFEVIHISVILISNKEMSGGRQVWGFVRYCERGESCWDYDCSVAAGGIVAVFILLQRTETGEFNSNFYYSSYCWGQLDRLSVGIIRGIEFYLFLLCWIRW